MCDHAPVCHVKQVNAAAAEINCRTCLHATPVEGGWHCARHDKALNDAQQRAACTQHLFIPSLVPGQQIDAGEDWVEYEFDSGNRWRDTGKNKYTNTILGATA